MHVHFIKNIFKILSTSCNLFSGFIYIKQKFINNNLVDDKSDPKTRFLLILFLNLFQNVRNKFLRKSVIIISKDLFQQLLWDSEISKK